MIVYQSLIKPILDYILAILISLILLVPYTLVYIYLHFELGSPLFCQQRTGFDQRRFVLYKFRTMRDGVEEEVNRISKFGRWLRRLGIDEWPQLLNVLKGEMSLVGPRPLLPEYDALYSNHQKIRFRVKPGITGWAQVNGRNEISWMRRFELDVFYVRNIGFWLDLKILFRTIIKILFTDEAQKNEEVIMPKFDGSN